MSGTPLSDETLRRAKMLFIDDDLATAVDLLTAECGNNLPFCETDGPIECERIRFAALKLSKGRIAELRQAIQLAKVDWRDLLMAAGFGHDPLAHRSWMPRAP